MFVDVLTTSAGMERVKTSVYGKDFSDQTFVDSQIDYLIDILLNGTLYQPDSG